MVAKEFYNFNRKKNKLFDFDNYRFKSVFYLENLQNLIRWKLKIDLSKDESLVVTEENFKLFEEVIFEANRVVKNNKAELIFVFLPFYQGTIDKESLRFQYYQKIINIVENQNITIVDLQKLMFDKSDDPKSFFPGRIHGHYTEQGYKIATKIILDNIAN